MEFLQPCRTEYLVNGTEFFAQDFVQQATDGISQGQRQHLQGTRPFMLWLAGWGSGEHRKGNSYVRVCVSQGKSLLGQCLGVGSSEESKKNLGAQDQAKTCD